MNTFYYFEGRIFETEEKAMNFTKNYNNKKLDKIQTEKSWDDFENEFDKAKEDGNSDLDAIEWAR